MRGCWPVNAFMLCAPAEHNPVINIGTKARFINSNRLNVNGCNDRLENKAVVLAPIKLSPF